MLLRGVVKTRGTPPSYVPHETRYCEGGQFIGCWWNSPENDLVPIGVW